MINRKYWRSQFFDAIQQNDQKKIQFLLGHNCQIDSDIFSAIIQLPDLDSEILDLAIKAMHEFESHHLQQVMFLFPNNDKAIIASIQATRDIEEHLLDELSTLDHISIAFAKNILTKLEPIDQSRLSKILQLAQNDQELINLGISKIKTLLPHNLQEIFAIQNITAQNLGLAIAKTQEIEEWNLTDLLDLKPSPEIVAGTIKKIDKLFGWHLQKLLMQGYDQLNILKLCVSKIDKLETWHLEELLRVANSDGQLIRLALGKIGFIDDVELIKSALDKTDFIRLGNMKLLLNNGIFDDVRELALAKLQTKLSPQELENYIAYYNRSPAKLGTEKQVQELYGAKKHNIHEDLSTESKKPLPSAVEFLKTIYNQHFATEYSVKPHPDSTVIGADATDAE